MLKITSLLIAALVLAFPVFAEAKTLYVNNSGSPACSDGTSYAINDASNPWCTVDRAAWGSTGRSSPNGSQAAQAGDTVLITAGVYKAAASSNSRFYPALNPANSGTAGNSITFRGVGTVYLRSTNGRGPVIGAAQRNYIVWDNFVIDEAFVNTQADTGPVVIWDSHHVTAKNLTITGDPAKAWRDNHNGIRIETANNITVQNNTITGFNQGDPGNYSAITLYSSTYVVMENNRIYNNGSGIFVKGSGAVDQGALTIRYNLLHNNVSADLRILGCEFVDGVYTRIYQNVMYGSPAAIIMVGAADPTPENIYIVNNTMLGTTGINFHTNLPSYADEIILRNNILSNSTRTFVHGLTWAAGWLESDRNVHYIGGGNPIYYQSSNVSIPSWASITGQDASSINASPVFVNATANNYRLQAGSPALTLGRTIAAVHGTTGLTIPAGAYITGNEVIGVVPAGGGLSTPGNLTIINAD